MARLSFRCSDELVVGVDAARGDVPRERWLRRAVERALSVADQEPPSSGGHVPSVGAAPAEQLERPLSRTEMFRRATQKR